MALETRGRLQLAKPSVLYAATVTTHAPKPKNKEPNPKQAGGSIQRQMRVLRVVYYVLWL
jgi:hypothetical protein